MFVLELQAGLFPQQFNLKLPHQEVLPPIRTHFCCFESMTRIAQTKSTRYFLESLSSQTVVAHLKTKKKHFESVTVLHCDLSLNTKIFEIISKIWFDLF